MYLRLHRESRAGSLTPRSPPDLGHATACSPTAGPFRAQDGGKWLHGDDGEGGMSLIWAMGKAYRGKSKAFLFKKPCQGFFVCCAHGFFDGNKRAARLMPQVFLLMPGSPYALSTCAAHALRRDSDRVLPLWRFKPIWCVFSSDTPAFPSKSLLNIPASPMQEPQEQAAPAFRQLFYLGHMGGHHPFIVLKCILLS